MTDTARQKRVPNVRFKGFTDDWEQRKGKELFISKTEKGFPQLPVLSATQDKGMIYRDNSGIDIKYDSKSLINYKLVCPGDFIVHLRSFQGGFAYSSLKGIASPAYTVFTFKDKAANSDYFWKEKFTSYNFIQLLKKVTYGVRDGRSISYTDFLSLREKFPSKDEQDRISQLFIQLERVLSLYQQKLSLLKQLKQGMLQKLFTNSENKQPLLRFNEFHGDWEQRLLKDNTDLITKGTTPHDKSGKGPVNFIKVENIIDGVIHPKKGLTLEEHNGYLKRSQLQAGDILFSIAGTLGRTAIVTPQNLPANTNQALAILRGYKFNSQFLITELAGNTVKDYIRKNPTVGAQPNLSLAQIGNFKIWVPKQNEQEVIGTLFNKVSRIITLYQNKINTLTNLKKFLLQQMFI